MRNLFDIFAIAVSAYTAARKAAVVEMKKHDLSKKVVALVRETKEAFLDSDVLPALEKHSEAGKELDGYLESVLDEAKSELKGKLKSVPNVH